MSTTMPASASLSNIAAATPGVSCRPPNVTRDCDSSKSIPSIMSFSMRCSRATSLAANLKGSVRSAAVRSSDRLTVLPMAGGICRANASWTARSACRADFLATTTEILIWLVVIIWTLIRFSAKARNICPPRRDCVAIPIPTTEIFETFSS